jgi:hypothetical protein
VYQRSTSNLKILCGGKKSKKDSLRRVSIPADVSIIGKECFSGCTSLFEITFQTGSELQRIEECAFSKTNVTHIEIPSSVEFLGKC